MRIRTYPLPGDHYVLVIDRAGALPETVQEFVSTAKANAGPKCAAVLVHADDVDLCDGNDELEGMVSARDACAYCLDSSPCELHR